MFAKVKNNQIVKYPYGYVELQLDNPSTNFNGVNLLQAFIGTESNLDGNILIEVFTEEQPVYDVKMQNIELIDIPLLDENKWILKWTIKNKSSEELQTQELEQITQVRLTRNKKLSACDWTQVLDAPVDRTAWSAYRQALRDVPVQAGFPWDVTWPIQPE